MRKWKNDFKTSQNRENWYDMEDDWELIASSLKTQYGYSIRKEINDMNWAELSSDISGLMADTPLGNIVQIRSEDDKEKLKYFTQEQKNIRWKYRMKIAQNVDKEEYKKVIAKFQQLFKGMAGDKKK
ncbi:MAG: Gp15 family bacteriophage protein [Clostridia bacterium]